MNRARTECRPSITQGLLTATLLLLWAFAPASAVAQMRNDHVAWELLTPEVSGKPGDIVQVKIRMTIAPKAHLYSMRTYPDSVMAPQPTAIRVGDTTILSSAGTISPSVQPIQKKDGNFDDLLTEYWEGDVTLTIPVKIAKKAKRGTYEGWVNIYFMTCNDKMCRPPTDEKFEFTVRVKRA